MSAPLDPRHAYQPFSYHSRDGLRLAGRRYQGEYHRLPLVCLAGLTRSSADFDDLAVYMSSAAKQRRTVITLDYRGRGESDYDPDWQNYAIPIELDDVLDGIAAAGVTDFALLGTSRGGLVAMAMGSVRPAPIKAVVLNDIGPVIAPEGLMRLKVSLNRMGPLSSFEAAAEQLGHQLAGQFPKLQAADWAKMARQLYRADGNGCRPNFDLNLVKTLDQFDPNTPAVALWHMFDTLAHVPMMVIKGEHSDLLSGDTMREMHRLRPDMATLEVAEEGHAPLLQDLATQKTIEQFLDGLPHG